MNHKKSFLAGFFLGCIALLCMAQNVIRGLRDLDDVRVAAAPSNGQVLSYNTSLAKWTNATSAASSGITNGADALLNSLTVTNAQTNLVVTASRAAIFDAAKRLTNSTVTDTELGYVSGVTSALQTQLNAKAPTASPTFTGDVTISGTANVSIAAAEASPTNVVDLSVAVATNVLNAAVTFLHATNGLNQAERTHVRWLWAGGSDRTLTIPSGWKTNVNSAVPASITNGTITRMFVTSIGATADSASQSNVFVSFEFYK